MSTTPLLSAPNGLPGPNVIQDHPAFLRVSHSPYRCIPQNVWVVLRGTVLAYLTAVTSMICHYKLTEETEDSPYRHFFDFGLVSYTLVTLYHSMTFTFTHLYYPDVDSVRGGIESLIVRAMSLPSNMGSLRKQFYFTLFYGVTSVFSFMNMAIYWTVTRPHDAPGEGAPGGGKAGLMPSHGGTDKLFPVVLDSAGAASSPVRAAQGPFSDLFGEGWFTVFILCNLYGVTSGLMTFETLFLNSTKRPRALGSHFLGVLFNLGLYLGWAAVGKAMTDRYAFFWLDEAEVGSKEAVAAYCIAFVLLAPIMYTLKLGFVGIREGITNALADRESSREEELET